MPYDIPQHRPPRLKRKARPHGQGKHYRTKEWAAIRKTVLIRDNFTCQACGKVCYGRNDAQVDHKTARAAGGKDELDNLQTLCLRCHGKKIRREQCAGVV